VLWRPWKCRAGSLECEASLALSDYLPIVDASTDFEALFVGEHDGTETTVEFLEMRGGEAPRDVSPTCYDRHV
jgi:hypothetical protein